MKMKLFFFFFCICFVLKNVIKITNAKFIFAGLYYVKKDVLSFVEWKVGEKI